MKERKYLIEMNQSGSIPEEMRFVFGTLQAHKL